ncbi:MAG: N-acetyl-gamma-glutamyl-phosphate reductase [candidate division WS1 bacterium]|nr:N-acetyl-gamma-glutamyl-phosphate reductase [candidate division WS1 bacterium]
MTVAASSCNVRVAVMGATGYAGAGVATYILGHPCAELIWVGSNTYQGARLDKACPWLRGRTNLVCQAQDVDLAARGADVVFMAQSNGFAMANAATALNLGAKVIDLSGDFRIKDTAVYERYYGRQQAAPELLAEAVYGLPEITGDAVRGARLVANTGCYPTGAVLGLYPLLAAGLISDQDIIIDATSGVSGAGRAKHALAYHYPEINETLTAYRVGNHQHTPEIEQALSVATGTNLVVTFTPHLAPISRGILSTCYARKAEREPVEGMAARCREALQAAYAGRPFVRIMPEGESPTTKATLGSNYCDIGVFEDPRAQRVIVVTAVDNLGRGAASQAIQNMNLMLGLDETLGINQPPLFP